MTPQQDCRLLLGLIDRHLKALAMNLDPAYPDEEWGFTAQQALEKLLKAWIVLGDQRPPFSHSLPQLMTLAGQELPDVLLALQPYAVEARYEQGPFPLPADRSLLLDSLRELRAAVEQDLQALGDG